MEHRAQNLLRDSSQLVGEENPVTATTSQIDRRERVAYVNSGVCEIMTSYAPVAVMKDEDAIQYLSELPDERLVAVLRRVFTVKQPAPEEAAYCRNRFYLGTAWSNLESDKGEPERWGPWELDAIAYVDSNKYGDELGPDYGLCQAGSCQSCGTRVRSNVKHGLCPICGGSAYMT